MNFEFKKTLLTGDSKVPEEQSQNIPRWEITGLSHESMKEHVRLILQAKQTCEQHQSITFQGRTFWKALVLTTFHIFSDCTQNNFMWKLSNNLTPVDYTSAFQSLATVSSTRNIFFFLVPICPYFFFFKSMLSLITLLFKNIFFLLNKDTNLRRFSNHKYKGIWVGFGLSMPKMLEIRKSPFFYVKDKIKLLILLRLWVHDWTDADDNNEEAAWLRQWANETETMTALNNPGWASSRSPCRIPAESRRPAEKTKALFQWASREGSSHTPNNSRLQLAK